MQPESTPQFHPMLYSTPMVQAILEERKGMTRRIIKEGLFLKSLETTLPSYYNSYDHGFCPYGSVGDIIWVRESFACVGGTEHGDYVEGGVWLYKADGEKAQKHLDVYDHLPKGWKPSIHMPKAACRLFLEITGVKVEKLQDINSEDARKEGLLFYKDEILGTRYKNYTAESAGYGSPEHDYPSTHSAKQSFKSLWESINGEKSWNENPFVWVVSFKRIEKPSNFL